MNKKALLGGLLPLLTNPGTMIIAAAGIVGITVYGFLTDKEKKENGSEAVEGGSEPYLGPLDNEDFSVEATVIEPLETVDWTVEETVTSAVDEPNVTVVGGGGCSDVAPQEETVSVEDRKKEMIRQAMSELGKRSAAARANKKNSRQL